MLRIFNISVNPSTPNGDVQSFVCQLAGDGVTKDFMLNLSKSPFDLKFTAVPVEADMQLSGADGLPSVSGTIAQNVDGDMIVQGTLSQALANSPIAVQESSPVFLTVTLAYSA